MPKTQRLRHGISVYKRFLHPRAAVAAKFPNAAKSDVLEGLIAVGQEEKTVAKKRQSCIIMRHDDFDDGTLLHAVTRYCKVQEEGALEHLFIESIQDPPEGTELASVELDQGNIGPEVPPLSRDEDATKFRTLGFAVDDDNDPASSGKCANSDLHPQQMHLCTMEFCTIL